MLQRLRGYLAFFRDELGGRFMKPLALKAELEQLATDRAQEAVGSAARLSPDASRARSGPAPSL